MILFCLYSLIVERKHFCITDKNLFHFCPNGSMPLDPDSSAEYFQNNINNEDEIEVGLYSAEESAKYIIDMDKFQHSIIYFKLVGGSQPIEATIYNGEIIGWTDDKSSQSIFKKNDRIANEYLSIQLKTEGIPIKWSKLKIEQPRKVGIYQQKNDVENVNDITFNIVFISRKKLSIHINSFDSCLQVMMLDIVYYIFPEYKELWNTLSGRFIQPKDKNSYLKFNYTGTNFIVLGFLEVDQQGSINIDLDGANLVENAAIPSEGSGSNLIYHSENISYGEHEIRISSFDDEKYTLTFLYYCPDPPPHLSRGLIYIPCDKVLSVYTWSKCSPEIPYISAGLSDSYSQIHVHFKGTKVYVLGKANDTLIAKIDGESELIGYQDVDDAHKSDDMIYISDDLQFGERRLYIRRSTNAHCLFQVSSILINPLPENGKIFNYKDMAYDANDWYLEYGYYLSSNRKGSTGTFKFYGTRFWLTGVRSLDHGEINITIDDQETITFNESEASIDPNGDVGILLHASKILDIGDHTVTVEQIGDKKISIFNFLYCRNPYNGVYYSSENIITTGNWKQIDNDGIFTSTVNSTATINGLFDQIWIFGNRNFNYADLKITYNDIEESIDTRNIQSSAYDNVLIYKSELLTPNRDDFNIEISSSENYPSLHISYCYYSYKLIDNNYFIDHYNEYRVSCKYFDALEGKDSWVFDNYENYFHPITANASITFLHIGGQFVIAGVADPDYGSFEVTIDGGNSEIVSCYAEKYIRPSIVYSSPNFERGEHTVIIKRHDERLFEILGIYLPPLVPTIQFSNSQIFSESNKFTISLKFSESNEFSNSLKFSESNKFTISLMFSESNEFSNSLKFSESNKFTKSLHFSGSDEFYYILSYSETDDFSSSETETKKYNENESISSEVSDSSKEQILETSFLDGILSKSKEFSKTDDFTKSVYFGFSLSETFKNYKLSTITTPSNQKTFYTLDYHSLSIQVSENQKITFSVSYSISFVMKKSVSFSLSYNEFLDTFTYLPFIIYYLSPSYIPLPVVFILDPPKKISQVQLIGISCGTAAVFFLILGFIIFIVRKKNNNFDYLSDEIFSTSGSSEHASRNDKNEISFYNDKSIRNDKNNHDNDDDDINFWL